MGFDALGVLALGEIPFVADAAPAQGGIFPRRRPPTTPDDEMAVILLMGYHEYYT